MATTLLYRFEHSRQKSNYLIAVACVYDNLTTNGCQKLEVDDLTTYGLRILPTNERQIRPFIQLEPLQQCEVFNPNIVVYVINFDAYVLINAIPLCGCQGHRVAVPRVFIVFQL